MAYPNHRSPRRSRPTPVVFGTFHLVLLDGTPLRKEAVSACKRARTLFEKAETELLDYEKTDVPAYERWYRGTFGVLLQEKEQMERDLEGLRQRLQRMMFLCLRTGCSGAEALEQLEKEDAGQGLREDPDAEPSADHLRQQEEYRKRKDEGWRDLVMEFASFLSENLAAIRRERKTGRNIREIRGRLQEEFAEIFQLPETILNAFFQREDVDDLWNKYHLTLELEPTSAPEESTESRIKRLMRELAFALHPDQCGVADERRLDLWHQVQAAVKAKDLDRLEVLHAHMQLLQGDLGPGLSVGRIQDLTRNYRKSREALRRKIRDLRKQVMWGFSKRKPDEKEKMRKVMEKELRDFLRRMRAEKRRLEKELNYFSRMEAVEEDDGDLFLDDLLGLDEFF